MKNSTQDTRFNKKIIFFIVLIVIFVAAAVITALVTKPPTSMTIYDQGDIATFNTEKSRIETSLSDTYVKNDAIAIRNQVRKYIEEHYDQDRKKPYLHEMNLITKSNMLVEMDKDPVAGKITYNSTTDCSGESSPISFSLIAFLSNSSRVCYD